MYKNKKILAIIPARGNSKGLPRKNVKPLLGKPLIAWTIEQAKDSEYIDRLIVSTDDEEIAEISKRYGAEVPFMRPGELAKDDSPVSDAILHAMDFLEGEKSIYDVVVLLECTSPMRYEEDIDNIVKKFIDSKNADSVVGVVEATNDHPMWSFKITDECLTKFIPALSVNQNLSRQLLEKAFLPYSMYVTCWENYKKCKTFYQPKTLPYLLKREQKVDIDDKVDFYLAECILRKYLKIGVTKNAVV